MPFQMGGALPTTYWDDVKGATSLGSTIAFGVARGFAALSERERQDAAVQENKRRFDEEMGFKRQEHADALAHQKAQLGFQYASLDQKEAKANKPGFSAFLNPDGSVEYDAPDETPAAPMTPKSVPSLDVVRAAGRPQRELSDEEFAATLPASTWSDGKTYCPT